MYVLLTGKLRKFGLFLKNWPNRVGTKVMITIFVIEYISIFAQFHNIALFCIFWFVFLLSLHDADAKVWFGTAIHQLRTSRFREALKLFQECIYGTQNWWWGFLSFLRRYFIFFSINHSHLKIASSHSKIDENFCNYLLKTKVRTKSRILLK